MEYLSSLHKHKYHHNYLLLFFLITKIVLDLLLTKEKCFGMDICLKFPKYQSISLRQNSHRQKVIFFFTKICQIIYCTKNIAVFIFMEKKVSLVTMLFCSYLEIYL